jgi:hypothetical protein
MARVRSPARCTDGPCFNGRRGKQCPVRIYLCTLQIVLALQYALIDLSHVCAYLVFRYNRTFASGTYVELTVTTDDLKKGEGCVYWGGGHVTGDATKCAAAWRG